MHHVFRADVAQLVEHSLGKGEVTSSILVISSRVLEVLTRLSSGFKMDQQKRFFIAMAVYVVLALLVWFTMDGSSVPVGNGQVSVRGLTFALLAFFAARTVLHWNAERIRAEKESQQ